MKLLLSASLFGAIATGGNLAQACNITPQRLIGSWVCVSSACEFQEMRFEREGNKLKFSSWLHQRPEIVNASWSLKQCQLQIKHQTLGREFRVVKLDGKQLWLTTKHSPEIAIYERL
jgi:hypothetical protein